MIEKLACLAQHIVAKGTVPKPCKYLPILAHIIKTTGHFLLFAGIARCFNEHALSLKALTANLHHLKHLMQLLGIYTYYWAPQTALLAAAAATAGLNEVGATKDDLTK